MDSFALFIASSVINVVTDVVMLAVPLLAIWDLHMATRRKVGIGAIFAVGTAYVFPFPSPDIRFFFFFSFPFSFCFSFVFFFFSPNAGPIDL